MSVLVEAISILIPRHALDERFPGGAEGYLRLARRAPGARWAISDDRITCVSFEALEDGQRFVEPLRQAGFDGSPDPVAFVDQYFGPTAVCRWMRWRRHDEGFTSCWLEGAEAGELVTPPGWGASRSDGTASAATAPSAVAEASAKPREKMELSFDAGLLPEEFEQIDVEPLATGEFSGVETGSDELGSAEFGSAEFGSAEFGSEELGGEDFGGEVLGGGMPPAAGGAAPEPAVQADREQELDVKDFPEPAAAPSPGFTLALDEVPPPLPADGWDPTEPVRDDASELAEDLPPSVGDGLFEPLHIGAALESALSAPARIEEPQDAGADERAVTAEYPARIDADPPAAVTEGESPAAPILTFRPPVGDGWDEEEERTAGARQAEVPPAVMETPAWGGVPQLATEEEDWWEEGTDGETPIVRTAAAGPPSEEEIAARVAAYEAQFTAEAPESYGAAEDDDVEPAEAMDDDLPAAAELDEDQAQLVYGAWLPDLPSSAGGAQPTPSSGTALLEAEDEEPEDYRGYHESYAAVADGIVPAFAVPDSVVEHRAAAAADRSPDVPSRIATTAFDLARMVLARTGWLLSEDEDGALLFQVRGSRARFQGTVSLERGADTLRIHTHLPTSVPAASRPVVAEFLLRAAPRLALGAFELDYESGEMRCRVNVDLRDAPLTETRLERLLGEGLTACDQYHDAVMQLVYAGRSVAEALAELDAAR